MGELDEKERERKEAELKEMQEKRKEVEKLESDSRFRDLTEEEKKMKENFYDARSLIAYKWWGRLNHPNRKGFCNIIETVPDMKYTDIQPSDVALLPWIEDFFVDVPKMTEWIINLDPMVSKLFKNGCSQYIHTN